MGKGRHTPTSKNHQEPKKILSLPPESLGAVIFFCSKDTYNECIKNLIFGLPLESIDFVENIQPGMALFLFNISGRMLHGVFEATTKGRLDINSTSWATTATGGKTLYPAQVHVKKRQHCEPLPEHEFKKVIATNYYTDKHFALELDHEQTRGLISMFAREPNISDLPARSHTMTAPNARIQVETKAIKLQEAEEEEDSCIKPVDLYKQALPFEFTEEEHVKTEQEQHQEQGQALSILSGPSEWNRQSRERNLQKKVDWLHKQNAMLQQTQEQMVLELQSLKSEVARISQRLDKGQISQ